MTDLNGSPTPSGLDREAAERLAEGALIGDWETVTDHHQHGIVTHSVWSNETQRYVAEVCADAPTAAFVAASRDLLTAALAALVDADATNERLRAENERLRKVIGANACLLGLKPWPAEFRPELEPEEGQQQ